MVMNVKMNVHKICNTEYNSLLILSITNVYHHVQPTNMLMETYV